MAVADALKDDGEWDMDCAMGQYLCMVRLFPSVPVAEGLFY